MDEAEDLLEDSWFFGNLLHTKTKTRTISRSYSDLSSSTCALLSYPPLCSSLANKDCENSTVSSRKQPPVAPPSLMRTPSLPNSMETQSFVMKKANPSRNSLPFHVRSDEKDDNIKNERKSANLSSRKQLPIPPSSSNSKERQSFQKKTPEPNLTRTSSMSTSKGLSDQEDEEDEEDQESEFSLGRLIRQASMNTSHASNLPRQTKATLNESMRKKPELVQEKIIDARKTERSRSLNRKNKTGNGAPAIPEVWTDKSSSEDMKTHIKFWARAVASNLRQECS